MKIDIGWLLGLVAGFVLAWAQNEAEGWRERRRERRASQKDVLLQLEEGLQNVSGSIDSI